MSAPMDPLRYGLADLAGQVRPVDLRDRVLRTSRRLAVRRAVLTSTAAVAVLATASGIALAVLPQRGTTPPLPSTTPSPSASPSTAPSPPSGQDTARILPGRLFYQSYQLPLQIDAWDGGTVTKVLQPAETTWFTARISPDGVRFAWVSDAEQLYVAKADGSGIRKVRDNVSRECIAPAWTPDSQRVLVGQPRLAGGRMEGYDLGYLDVDSGSFQPIADIKGCHFTLSPSGDHLAYADGGGKAWVARPDGTVSRVIPLLGNDDPQLNPQRARTFDIYSLSPDGNLLICRLRTGDQTNGDVALDMYANAVIDARTGKQVTLPVNGELINAIFLTDGSLLARLKGSTRNELVLISKDWKVLDRIDEPADLKDRPLLAYVPA